MNLFWCLMKYAKVIELLKTRIIRKYMHGAVCLGARFSNVFVNYSIYSCSMVNEICEIAFDKRAL